MYARPVSTNSSANTSIKYIILHTWLTCRALSVTGDASHSSHSLSSLLPSGKSVRSLQARCQTASASEQAVRMPNSAHCPSTLTFDTTRSALYLHYSHLFWMRDITFWFFFLVIQRIDNKKYLWIMSQMHTKCISPECITTTARPAAVCVRQQQWSTQLSTEITIHTDPYIFPTYCSFHTTACMNQDVWKNAIPCQFVGR